MIKDIVIHNCKEDIKVLENIINNNNIYNEDSKEEIKQLKKLKLVLKGLTQ